MFDLLKSEIGLDNFFGYHVWYRNW